MVKRLVVTYCGAIVLTWLGYLFRWLTLVGAVGTTLILLGLLVASSWLSMWVDR